MSEANIPPTSGSPESAPIAPPQNGIELDDSLTGDVWQDWQTVNFPNAVSVEAIAAADAAADDSAQVANLIDLIQQLNECNTQLLDRVEQLEAAIELSQTDLQTEIAHHQEVAAAAEARETAMQGQMAQLMQQLEMSHQANQRQQILVETLSEQLENSQERIAQLERECSIGQQRCGEQAQKIVEVENTNRDLQIRLQRQQRYTMQFKVALNKCLDVPAPCYEAEADRSIEPSMPGRALLPKLASIQPWSSQPQFPELDPEANLPQLQRLRSASRPETEAIEPTHAVSSDRLSPTLSEWIDSPVDAIEAAEPADAEVVVDRPAESSVIETIEITADMLHDLSEPPAEAPAASEEDGLWQDLARLIEVSAEDVARASAAEDFAEFAQQLAAEPDWQPATIASSEPPAPQTPPEPAVAEPTLPIAASAESIVQSNWPSPVVYPLRPPTRKRQSLAAVELPNFSR